MKKLFVTGVLVSIISGALLIVFWRVFEQSISMGNLIFFIPVGLLAGYIGTKLENRFAVLKELDVFLTIIVSAILTYITFNFVWGDFIYWFLP